MSSAFIGVRNRHCLSRHNQRSNGLQIQNVSTISDARFRRFDRRSTALQKVLQGYSPHAEAVPNARASLSSSLTPALCHIPREMNTDRSLPRFTLPPPRSLPSAASEGIARPPRNAILLRQKTRPSSSLPLGCESLIITRERAHTHRDTCTRAHTHARTQTLYPPSRGPGDSTRFRSARASTRFRRRTNRA